MKYPWFDKLDKFEKEIALKIKHGEKDIDHVFDLQLPKVIDNLTKIVPQIRKWAKIIAQLDSYLEYLNIEFEQYDSLLFSSIKREMQIQEDERKIKGLRKVAFTDTEVKIKRAAVPERVKMLKGIQRIKSSKEYISKSLYWTSINSKEVLETLAKFCIPSETGLNLQK